jgi:transcriptional regulator of arginine metabolism
MPRSSTGDRTARRHRLLALLEDGFEGTQDEIVRRIAEDGFTVTQATVSRDLESLGAIRRHSGDRFVYALPARNGPPDVIGRQLLSELLVEVAVSGNMVVLRTFPGMASTLAAIVDSSDLIGALGTIAGDDTVLVVADERTGGRGLARRIRKKSEQRGAS